MIKKYSLSLLFIIFMVSVAFGQSPTSSQNYLMETQVRVVGKKTEASLTGLTVAQANRTINYFDGLGRPIQTVQWRGSPLMKDLVQPIAYDAVGREVLKYLPYAEQTSNNGTYKAGAIGNQTSFYGSGGWDANVKKTPYPVNRTVFEPSPLGRVLEQGAAGAVWQPYNATIPGSGHTVKQVYAANAGTDVQLWTVNASGASVTGNYNAAKLYLTITKDENWSSGKAGTTEEFTDTEGQLVLKRVWQDESTALNTYYVYNTANLLCYVIPPGVNTTTTTSFIESDSIFDQFIYGYHYDGRKRLVEKKVPGKGWEYLIYNKLDQVVFTQDANQRATYQWTFNKYDGLGRVILTGFYQRNSDRFTFQTYVLGLGLPLWETRDSGSANGYTNVSYPNASITASLTANYYDDYNFGVTIPPSVTVSAKIRSLLTGTRVYQTDGTLPRWTVYYYDEEARAKETIAENHLGGADRYISNHNFAGELTSSTRLHVALGNTTVIGNVYSYDHTGRQLNNKMNINSLGEVILSKLEYNEIGQLRQKQLHSDNAGASFLDASRYARNERGWLKDIASAQFSFKLGYDTLASPQYNGNISTQLWGAASSYPNQFLYTYDKLNRLTSGASTGIDMAEAMTYDAMGNIKTLSRDYGTANIYFYNGNKLSHVNGVTNPYSYDANGNATIDGRMNLTQTYNHLNLVKHATTTGLNVYYTYNALGVKLKKEVLTGSTVTTDYVDGIQYTGGVIDFIQTAEGRARNTGSGYAYEYNLTDHLGNVRYSFDKNAGIPRKLQADDYYPFGLRKVVTLGSNAYLYNSKELQTELGKYDYGARMYDAVIGRWNVVDALSENHYSINPYNYVLNNPINTIDPLGLDTTKASNLDLDTWRNFKTNKDVIGLNEITISTNRGEQRAIAAYSAILADVQRNYRVGVGGLFQGYPDNLKNIAADRFYSKYIKYNEINPFTGEMRVLGLKDANWIVDLASGGIISLVRTGAALSAARGGVQYTKSSLKIGQEMHKAYKVGANGLKEFRLPSGKRIDFLDVKNSTIYELKPFNPRAIKAGQNQLNMYMQELQTMPQFKGVNWKTILDTY